MQIDDAISITASRWKGKKSKAGVDYIDHIPEGLADMNLINSTIESKIAFVLHPLFQTPTDLKESLADKLHEQIPQYILMLVMEYRNKANACVCRPRTDHFVKHYNPTHRRKEQLANYFGLWFEHLEVHPDLIKFGIDYVS